MPDEAIQVAVRVRPFNDREKARKAINIIDMPDGKRTGIRDPANMKADPKWFAFDHSYWSHDSFTDNGGHLEGTTSKYADQKTVFDDLGRGVLHNAWNGYNCSLFAYGQTGSGKSYSMVGYGQNKGIVPIACEELFKQIDQKKSEGSKVEYQVSVSMLEIYCEKVRDLLDNKPAPKGGLKVREHPKKGFYVDNLLAAPVNSYKAIEARIDEGTRNRTVAATNMNATSSRAHTIVQISFIQKDPDTKTTKSSVINLVDLAGSERHSETGSEGDRLKEGIVINQSLSTLGRCIKALHDAQTAKGGKKGSVQVPFRDSVLTSLLKNALGGNSKTIMIAALSPADINYEETLSTLRFADRAKSIKTKAVVNESATDRLIRELREENQKLLSQLKTGGGGGGAVGSHDDDDHNDEVEELRRQLEANKMDMEKMEQTWQSRLQQEGARTQVDSEETAKRDEQRKTMPHFWNLNEDPALTNMVVHFIKKGELRIGNNKAQPPADIQLNGLSILKDHAKLKNPDNKKITIVPLPGARILINGKEASKETELSHNDRLMFGGNHLYVFAHPQKAGKKTDIPTYDQAQKEIAESSGIMGVKTGAAKSKEDMILEEELIHLLPQVYQANAMSDELKKDMKFEIVLVAPQARGLKQGTTEVYVKAVCKSTDNEFLWDKNKFTNRYYGMQELYQNFIEGYKDWDVSKDRDPFYEPPNSEVMIGGVYVYLQSLAYMVELDEQLPVTDFKGHERGQLSISVVPCTPQGKEITGEFVDSPNDLVGKNLSFKVKILNAVGLPRKFANSYCKYKFYLEEKEHLTAEVHGSNPTYGHEKTFSFKPVTKQLVDYLTEQALYIQIIGKQAGKDRRRSIMAYNAAPGGDQYKAKADKLEAKLNKIQRILDDALNSDSKNIPIKSVQKVLKEDDDSRPTMNGHADMNGEPPAKPKKKKKPKEDKNSLGAQSNSPSTRSSARSTGKRSKSKTR